MQRSPGASLAAVLAACLAVGAAAQTGDQAFRERDYTAAAELWREEAAAGSAGAAFGLGLLADLGLGQGRDAATALRWYLEAAGRGLPVAQFNVGVMLDAGSGVSADPSAAAIWYARAAANGHPRARYNLGLLYESGTGVTRNPDLAALWYEAAAPDIPAARERLADLPPLPPEDRELVAPAPVTGDLVRTAAGPRAELVWTAPPGPEGVPFSVELAPEIGARAALSAEVGVSSLSIPLPGDGDWIWRVGRAATDGRPPAWSDWQQVAASGSLPSDAKRLVIFVASGDGLARAYAEELTARFASGGLGVSIREAADPFAASDVAFSHDADAELAQAVAAAVPGLNSARPDRALGLAPGEIALRLAGGPARQDPER